MEAVGFGIEDPGSAGRRLDEPKRAADRRRLAGTVRAEETENPTVGDRQIQPVDRYGAAATETTELLVKRFDLDDGHRRNNTPVRAPFF